MVIGTERAGYDGSGRVHVRASAAVYVRGCAPRHVLPTLIPGLALDLSLLRLISP
jgi:hypothetical protein